MLTNGRKGTTQARGRIRRRQLLDAVKDLLADHEVDAISLGDVAERADISKGAAYHLFGSLDRLYSDLVREFDEEIMADFVAPIPVEPSNWKDIVDACFQRGVEYYARSPAARRLLLGAKTPPEIKRSDRANDLLLGAALKVHIEKWFELPAIVGGDRIFFHAIEVLDLFFCLSVMERGYITPAMAGEAKRAAFAYLSLYIPPILLKLDHRPNNGKAEKPASGKVAELAYPDEGEKR